MADLLALNAFCEGKLTLRPTLFSVSTQLIFGLEDAA